jgi:hypothetical protein
MPQKIHFDFYKIGYTKTSKRKLGKILKKEDVTQFKEFNKAGKEHSFALPIKQQQGFVLGTILSNQMSNIPSSYDKLEKKLTTLNIKPSQGLAHLTSFLYDPALKILMFQSNKNGASINTFCSLIESNIANVSIVPNFLLNPSDLQKLQEMTVIRKLFVKIYNNGVPMNGVDKSVEEMVSFANDANNDYFEFAIVNTRNQSSLKVPKILGFVKSLLGKKEEQAIEKIEVKGKGDAEKKMRTLNLITNRLRPHINIKTTRFTGEHTINSIFIEMSSLYLKHRDEFRAAYEEKN